MGKRVLTCDEDYRTEAIDAIDAFDERVHAAETIKAWNVPTPCEGWATGDLIAHVSGSVRMFVTVAGLQVSEQRQGADGELNPADVIQEWERIRAVAEEYLRTCGEPGLIRVPLGEREITIAFAIEALVRDVVIHTWDLGHATGGDEVLPAHLVTAATASLTRLPQRIRERGLYSNAVDPAKNASDQERLLALAGRSL